MAHLKTIVLIVAGTVVATAGMALASETITYTYDARGRVISVVHNGSVNDDLVVNYTFDDADNRKLLNVTGSGTPP